MKAYTILIIFLTSLIAGCKVDQLDTWNQKGRVWFSSEADSIFSFKKLDASLTEVIIDVPLKFAGTLSNGDREIQLEVSKDKSSPETRFEILRPVVIEGGASTGVVKVKVFKTNNLSITADSIVMAIKSSKDLDAGIVKNLEKKLVFSNFYVRPWWWYDFNLGQWSEEKHAVIIEVLGSDNDIRGKGAESNFRRGWTHPDALYNIYLLNKYCEEKNLSFRFKS